MQVLVLLTHVHIRCCSPHKHFQQGMHACHLQWLHGIGLVQGVQEEEAGVKVLEPAMGGRGQLFQVFRLQLLFLSHHFGQRCLLPSWAKDFLGFPPFNSFPAESHFKQISQLVF